MHDIDPLEQRMVKCPSCKGAGRPPLYDPLYDSPDLVCPTCSGTGEVLESEGEWAKRNARIARVLAKPTNSSASCRYIFAKCEHCGKIIGSDQCIAARLEAAAKEEQSNGA
jgi:RecJ-like exonuclease